MSSPPGPWAFTGFLGTVAISWLLGGYLVDSPANPDEAGEAAEQAWASVSETPLPEIGSDAARPARTFKGFDGAVPIGVDRIAVPEESQKPAALDEQGARAPDPSSSGASSPSEGSQDCSWMDLPLQDARSRDVAFEGTLLGHRQVAGSLWSLFLVRRSWRGVRSDTVSVRPPPPPVVESRWPPWPVGERYLVLGDLDGARIVPGPCDPFLPLAGEGERLAALGEPERVLTPEGLRGTMSDAIRPGANPGSGGGERTSVSLSVLGEYGVIWNADVELAGLRERTDALGTARFDGVPVGLHEGRVTIGDSTHAFQLLIDCIVEGPRCREVSGRIRTHPVVPGGFRSLIADEPTFTPFSEAPRLLNQDEVQRHVRTVFPGAEFVLQPRGERRDASSEFFLFVDEAGKVERIWLRRSSGRREVDAAVVKGAKNARLSPALGLQGRIPVPVWVRGYLVAPM